MNMLHTVTGTFTEHLAPSRPLVRGGLRLWTGTDATATVITFRWRRKVRTQYGAEGRGCASAGERRTAVADASSCQGVIGGHLDAAELLAAPGIPVLELAACMGKTQLMILACR